MKSKIIAVSAIAAGFVAIFLTLGAYIEFIDLIGVVPDDQSIIVATNKGEPAVTDNKSLAGSSYRNIVKRIMGEDVPFEDWKKHSFMDKIKSLLMKKK